jgi:sugar lactone lactonase YvrE
MGTEGVFDFSYLWVANTSQGGISKIATDTMLEEGRYIVDANAAAASSSRTAVSLDGRFVVVANRGTYTITKVAANVEDCVDTDNDGMITTSQGKDDVLPFGEDECRIWTTPVQPQPANYVGGPRGLAWEPGTFNEETCKYENPSVWVGWHTGNGVAYMGRFDGATGEQTDTVQIKDWTASHAPYGAAMDGFGNLWFNGVFTGDIYRIDTVTLGLQRWSGGPTLQPYGNTVDVDGNFWLAGYNGPVSYFDPEVEQFVTIAGTHGRHRGIAIDGQKRVWAATNSGGQNYGCGFVQIDGVNKTFVGFHTLPQCSTPVGVSVDAEGFIWIVDYAGWAFKINGDDLSMEQVLISDVHYTYSDMTGGGLKGVIVPG